MEFISWVSAILIALTFVVGLAGLASPLVVPYLKNIPLPTEPGEEVRPHFFTDVDPYTAKVIRRGGRVVRYLISYPEHVFVGGGEVRKGQGPDARQVVAFAISKEEQGEGEEGEQGEIKEAEEEEGRKEGKDVILLSEKEAELKTDPFAHVRFPPYRWWQRYILATTGSYFTGIWPWQRVHSYGLPRVEVKIEEDGTRTYIKRRDVSDFVNLRYFTWFFLAKGIEAAGKLPMTVAGSVQAMVINPELAEFGSDEWHVALDQAIYTQIRDVFRTLSPDQILGLIPPEYTFHENQTPDENVQEAIEKQREEELHIIGQKIITINDDMQKRGEGLEKLHGLRIAQVQVTNTDPEVSKEEMRELYAPFLAQQRAKADNILGEGKGQYLAHIIKSVADGNDVGRLVQQIEGQIATAREGGATVLFGQGSSGPGGMDPLLYDELRKMNASIGDLEKAMETIRAGGAS